VTDKSIRIVSVLCLVAALFSAALLPAAGYAETLRFVFLGDSRSDTRPSDPANLDEAINTPVLNAIIAQIQKLSPPPAFVVYGGDQGYRGGFTYSSTDYYVFQTFKDLFAPLTNAGIPLYTAIGNHELYLEHSDDGFWLTNQEKYQQVFAENPANGPAGFTPSYDHLVYSFTSPGGDAFFAVLDPYFLTIPNVIPSGLGGTIDSNQLSWLQAQLAQTTATHKFLFIHVPYYYVFNDPDEPNGEHDSTWTQLWNILDSNNFDLFGCGHTHLYSRKNINISMAPNPPLYPLQWRNNVTQLICGTCGAGPSTGTPSVDPILWHISNAPDTYYFSVVDIKGPQVTVTSYEGNTGAYTVFDSFNLHSGISPVNFLLMN
jgi:hypothetical protein